MVPSVSELSELADVARSDSRKADDVGGTEFPVDADEGGPMWYVKGMVTL